ncbi:MAG: chitobiase/beta-hexosaminidase C-terminal domain-containing protein, partial [Oscillospiraceae bacterium]|nr:chitobiase/beta-hexosaminidase C-terminal domain-containing protein [Oscillospiraceae bacterium]
MLKLKIRWILAWVLSLSLAVGLLPLSVFAVEAGGIENRQILNSACIADYGEESYVILDDGVVALKDWQENTLIATDIKNAKAIAINGEELIVAVQEEGYVGLLKYSIPTKEIIMLAEIDEQIDSFSMCGDIVYYSTSGNIYAVDIRSGNESPIYTNGDVLAFYLYANDVLAFLPDSEQEDFEDTSCFEDQLYDPYQLLYLDTSVIEPRSEFESRLYDISSTKDVNYSVTVGSVTMPFSDLKNGSYFTTTGKACSNHTSCARYWPKTPGNSSKVDTLGWQCFGFAELAYYRLFGHLSYSGDGGSSRTSPAKSWKAVANVAASSISVNYLKNLLGTTSSGTVRPGAHIRTRNPAGNTNSSNGTQHSLVYMGRDNTYVYTYEGNMDGKCRVSIIRRTWAEMASYLTTTKKGINFIAMPNSYPGPANPAPAAPTITQSSYVGGKTITISASSGAAIYYTTDGGTPTTSSTRYSTPFKVTSSVTVKAIANISGRPNSSVASQTVTVN